MTTATSTLMLGSRHFRVEFRDRFDGRVAATLWVPTSEACCDSLFTEADRFARLTGRPLEVFVAGESTGVTCGV